MGRGLILIRQLASRGHLSSKRSFRVYPVLAVVSNCYPKYKGRSSTRYSPVRHFTHPRRDFRVRLACVKHAASVQSEPESNSPVQICVRSLLSRNQNLKDSFTLPTRYSLVNERPRLTAVAASQRRGADLCTLSSPVSTSFFRFPKISFRSNTTRWRGGALCSLSLLLSTLFSSPETFFQHEKNPVL